MKYTAIRISTEDKKRLEILSKKLGKNLADTLRFAIEIAEREVERFKGDLDRVLSTLRYAKDVGETDAKNVNEYLYGSSD